MNQTEMGFWMSAFCASLTGGQGSHVAERFADDAVRIYKERIEAAVVPAPARTAPTTDAATIDGKIGSPIKGPIKGRERVDPNFNAANSDFAANAGKG